VRKWAPRLPPLQRAARDEPSHLLHVSRFGVLGERGDGSGSECSRRAQAARRPSPWRTMPHCSQAIAGFDGGRPPGPARRVRRRSRGEAMRACSRMARPARAPNTTPSSSELLARPVGAVYAVQAASPAANRRGRLVRPLRSVRTRPWRSGRRRDRRRLATEVDSMLEAGFVCGEAFANKTPDRDGRGPGRRGAPPCGPFPRRWPAPPHRAARAP